MNPPALHPRMAEVITALRDAQQEMHTLVGDLTPEMAARAPADGAWSVAQIVEHLAIVEDGTARLIAKLIKQVEGTVETATDAIASTLTRFRVDAEEPTPINAPAFVTPGGALSLAQAAELQAMARERLIAALTAASGRALGSVSQPHPVIGTLDGYQWALFVALHQRRHLHQIRRTLALLAV